MAESGARQNRSEPGLPVVQTGAEAAPAERIAERPAPSGDNRPQAPGSAPRQETPRVSPGSPVRTSPGTGPGHTPGGPTGPGGAPPARRRGRGKWLWIGAAVVLAGLLVYAVVPHGGAQQGGPGQPGAGPGGGRRGAGGPGGRGGGAPVSINTGKVARADMPIYLTALGTVTPVATVAVHPQVSGQLTKLGFQEGQMVRQGQFLAQIDPRPYQQVVAQAQGVLARDQANLQNARVQLQRFQTLLAQDSIARQQVDDQAALVRQLEATLKTDQANIGAAQLNVTYAHITAPVSGRVGLRQVDVGNLVSAGTASTVVVVTQVAPIDVLFTMPEDNLPQVASRVRAGAVLPVAAFDRTQTNELAQGKLLTLDNVIDTSTGTVRAMARFTNSDAALFPNQFVNVRVLVDMQRNVLTAPASAVLRGANGLFVYVVKPDHTVTVRNVQTGVTVGQVTAITSGLQEGETVVTDGSDRLREGARVLLPGECPPAGFGGGRRGQGGQRGQGGAPGAGQGGAGAGQAGAGRRFGGQGGFAGCRPGGRGGVGAGAQGGQSGFGGPGAAPGGFAQGGAQGGAQGPGQAGGFGGDQGTGQTAGQPQGGASFPPPRGASNPAAAAAARGGRPGVDQGQGGGGQASAGQGFAGGAGGQAGPGGRGGGMMAMLGQLNLDAGQQAKAQALLQQARAQAQANPDDPDARRAAMGAAMQQINALLRPDQKAKLAQLRAQGGFGGGRFGGGGQGGGQGGGDQGPAGQP